VTSPKATLDTVTAAQRRRGRKLRVGGWGSPEPGTKVMAPEFRGMVGAAEVRRRRRLGQGGAARHRGSAPAAGGEAGGSAGAGGGGMEVTTEVPWRSFSASSSPAFFPSSPPMRSFGSF
jgi:hypothetical protein